MVKLFVSWVLQREGEYPEFGSTIIDDVRAPKYGHDLFRLKLELAERLEKEKGRKIGAPVILYFVEV